jgi:hypothetical protein
LPDWSATVPVALSRFALTGKRDACAPVTHNVPLKLAFYFSDVLDFASLNEQDAASQKTYVNTPCG